MFGLSAQALTIGIAHFISLLVITITMLFKGSGLVTLIPLVFGIINTILFHCCFIFVAERSIFQEKYILFIHQLPKCCLTVVFTILYL